ncbi:MAG TPA: site-2 protease family protein [Candidatus Saccharimonadales bacterium]|nr:site-2 protease family protein [Candidatus Saccharimonadales bacterium]
MLGNLHASDLLIFLFALIISMVIHEFMHGFVAYKLGDTTAQEEGRLSFNPLAHIDPFMTIILPAITLLLVGIPILAAKPVPFNPARLKYDDMGVALVAAAGPVSNLVLAIIGAFILNGMTTESFAAKAIYDFVTLNVALFVFNLVPIPPLDGSRIVYAFAPEPVRKLFEQIEPYGFFIVFGLLFTTHFAVLTNINQMVLDLLSHL